MSLLSVPAGLFVYGLSDLTGVASTFAGCTFWPLAYILGQCFLIYSFLLLALWIFFMLFGPPKINYVAIL